MDSQTKFESSAIATDKPSLGVLPLLSKLIAWIGVSTGALTLICTIFGYVVEHAWLERLGIPRTAYDSTSNEYVVSGVKFLASIIPLAVTGALEFALDDWWMIPLVGLFAFAAWKWRPTQEVRLVAASGLYAIWLASILWRFDRDGGRPDPNALAIFCFGTVMGLIYCYQEAYVASRSPAPRSSHHLISRLPLIGLVFCSVFALPYLKGSHGTERPLPTIRFMGKDRAYFCELAGNVEAQDCGSWELIELGKDRALLRRPPDRRIIVVPASSITTFQLQGSVEVK